jgi:hypothetical protein
VSKFPIDKGTVRPFRIWNATDSKPMPHRYFAFSWSAIDSCWKDVQWVKVGIALEVHDISRPRALPIAVMRQDRKGLFYRWVHKDFNIKHVPKSQPKRKKGRKVKLKLVKAA